MVIFLIPFLYEFLELNQSYLIAKAKYIWDENKYFLSVQDHFPKNR